MKGFHLIAICIFLISNSIYSQDNIELKKDYNRDTIQGKHFGRFVKPADTDGVIFKEQKNKQSAYFKKCEYLEISDERKKCFSETFYGVLRKNLSFNSKILKEKEIEINVKFTINKLGKIEDVIFVKSNDLTGEFEKEILRVLKKLPKIIPTRINNEFVNSTYIFPINFNNK